MLKYYVYGAKHFRTGHYPTKIYYPNYIANEICKNKLLSIVRENIIC